MVMRSDKDPRSYYCKFIPLLSDIQIINRKIAIILYVIKHYILRQIFQFYLGIKFKGDLINQNCSMLSDGQKNQPLPYQEGQSHSILRQVHKRRSLDNTKREFTVLSSIQELNFQNFASSNLSVFHAKVTGIRPRVISSTVKNFVGRLNE